MAKEIKVISAEEIIYMLKEKYDNIENFKFVITEKRIPIHSENHNHYISGHIFDGVELTIDS